MTRALVVLAALLVAVAAVGSSSASFTAAAKNASSFATAADWVAPTVAITAPADGLRTSDATPTLTGTAGNATGDATSVTVRISNGSGVVQTLTPTRSGTSWTTTAATLAEGSYTVQATQSDASGNTGTSSTVTFVVDTTKPTGTAISATNATGGTAGKLNSGDTIAFTFSEAIDPTSVLSSWSGASTAVRVRFTNAGFLGSADTFTVLDASSGTTVKLATTVATNGDYVSATATIAATMALSADRTSVVITLGTPSSVSLFAVGAQNMSWPVPAGIKDLAGNATVTATRAETDSDVDF